MPNTLAFFVSDVKATLDFMDFVLGDLTGLNAMFQSESFQLHRFLHEVEWAVKMVCRHFMLSAENDLQSIDVDDEGKWSPLEMVYTGIMASESVKEVRPHDMIAF